MPEDKGVANLAVGIDFEHVVQRTVVQQVYLLSSQRAAGCVQEDEMVVNGMSLFIADVDKDGIERRVEDVGP